MDKLIAFFQLLHEYLQRTPKKHEVLILLVSATSDVILKSDIFPESQPLNHVDWISMAKSDRSFAPPNYRSIEEMKYIVDPIIGRLGNMGIAANAVMNEYKRAAQCLMNKEVQESCAFEILTSMLNSSKPIMTVIRLRNSREPGSPSKKLKRAKIADADDSRVGEYGVDATQELPLTTTNIPHTPRTVSIWVREFTSLVKKLQTTNPVFVIQSDCTTESIKKQLKNQEYEGALLENENELVVSDLTNINVILVVIEKMKIGERLPKTCLHYDVRCRYLKSGISSKAAFVQDVGRCAGHDKPKANVYLGIDHQVSGFKSLHQLLDAMDKPTRENPQHALNSKVYTSLKDKIIVLDAAPQIGKTGVILSVLGILDGMNN